MQSTLDDAIEERVKEHVRYYSTLGTEALDRRLEELDREWDMERAVTIGLSGLGLFGLAIGRLGGRSFRLLTWMSLPLLFAFTQGRWSPPSFLKETLGLRNRRIIEEERYALKALRGDFEDLDRASAAATEALSRQATKVMEAVRK